MWAYVKFIYNIKPKWIRVIFVPFFQSHHLGHCTLYSLIKNILKHLHKMCGFIKWALWFLHHLFYPIVKLNICFKEYCNFIFEKNFIFIILFYASVCSVKNCNAHLRLRTFTLQIDTNGQCSKPFGNQTWVEFIFVVENCTRSSNK